MQQNAHESSAPAHAWLSGPGEMRERVRAFDWSRTALGPIESWPEMLRSAADACLASPFPLSVVWGREALRLYNDAFIAILGRHHPAALGSSWLEVWPEQAESIRILLDRVFAGETILEQNRPWTLDRFGKPEQFFLSYGLTPLRDCAGTVRGALLSIQDNTQAVQAESDRERLRLSEERGRQILSSTRDCIKVLDLAGRLLSMNLEGQQRLGIDDFEDVRQATWADLWPAEYRVAARHAIDEALQGGAGRFEGNFLTLKGENTWWDVTVTPIRDAQGATTELLVVSREVTGRKHAEQALIRSEKLAAVGRLAASIAHEINNPLEAVTNLLYLARRSEEPGEIQQHLEIADRELRRVAAIANQTLRFHRQSTHPTEVSFEELIESVLVLYQGRLLNADVVVEKRLRARRAVLCFEGEIRQTLANLVGNAIDAMAATGGRLLLRSREGTDWAKARRGIFFTVADTGSGMPETVRAQLFEAFFTTKGIAGTGLGLWISRDIVARHRGTIRVRSRQRHGNDSRSGTVFTIFLPTEHATHRDVCPEPAVPSPVSLRPAAHL